MRLVNIVYLTNLPGEMRSSRMPVSSGLNLSLIILGADRDMLHHMRIVAATKKINIFCLFFQSCTDAATNSRGIVNRNSEKMLVKAQIF